MEWTKGREGYAERLRLIRIQPLVWKKKQFFVQSYKSRAHDLDREHTVDAGSPGDHGVQVWSQSGYRINCEDINLNLRDQINGYSMKSVHNVSALQTRDGVLEAMASRRLEDNWSCPWPWPWGPSPWPWPWPWP